MDKPTREEEKQQYHMTDTSPLASSSSSSSSPSVSLSSSGLSFTALIHRFRTAPPRPPAHNDNRIEQEYDNPPSPPQSARQLHSMVPPTPEPSRVAPQPHPQMKNTTNEETKKEIPQPPQAQQTQPVAATQPQAFPSAPYPPPGFPSYPSVPVPGYYSPYPMPPMPMPYPYYSTQTHANAPITYTQPQTQMPASVPVPAPNMPMPSSFPLSSPAMGAFSMIPAVAEAALPPIEDEELKAILAQVREWELEEASNPTAPPSSLPVVASGPSSSTGPTDAEWMEVERLVEEMKQIQNKKANINEHMQTGRQEYADDVYSIVPPPPGPKPLAVPRSPIQSAATAPARAPSSPPSFPAPAPAPPSSALPLSPSSLPATRVRPTLANEIAELRERLRALEIQEKNKSTKGDGMKRNEGQRSGEDDRSLEREIFSHAHSLLSPHSRDLTPTVTIEGPSPPTDSLISCTVNGVKFNIKPGVMQAEDKNYHNNNNNQQKPSYHQSQPHSLGQALAHAHPQSYGPGRTGKHVDVSIEERPSSSTTSNRPVSMGHEKATQSSPMPPKSPNPPSAPSILTSPPAPAPAPSSSSPPILPSSLSSCVSDVVAACLFGPFQSNAAVRTLTAAKDRNNQRAHIEERRQTGSGTKGQNHGQTENRAQEAADDSDDDGDLDWSTASRNLSNEFADLSLPASPAFTSATLKQDIAPAASAAAIPMASAAPVRADGVKGTALDELNESIIHAHHEQATDSADKGKDNKQEEKKQEQPKSAIATATCTDTAIDTASSANCANPAAPAPTVLYIPVPALAPAPHGPHASHYPLHYAPHHHGFPPHHAPFPSSSPFPQQFPSSQYCPYCSPYSAFTGGPAMAPSPYEASCGDMPFNYNPYGPYPLPAPVPAPAPVPGVAASPSLCPFPVPSMPQAPIAATMSPPLSTLLGPAPAPSPAIAALPVSLFPDAAPSSSPVAVPVAPSLAVHALATLATPVHGPITFMQGQTQAQTQTQAQYHKDHEEEKTPAVRVDAQSAVRPAVVQIPSYSPLPSTSSPSLATPACAPVSVPAPATVLSSIASSPSLPSDPAFLSLLSSLGFTVHQYSNDALVRELVLQMQMIKQNININDDGEQQRQQ